MVKNTGGKNEQTRYDADLSMLEELLESASSSITQGNYERAISDFEQVVALTQDIFGGTGQLDEIKGKIKEIQELLGSIKK